MLKKLSNSEVETGLAYMSDWKLIFQRLREGLEASWSGRGGLLRRLGGVTKKQKDVRRCEHDTSEEIFVFL